MSRTVDNEWDAAFSTPKMRGLKQMFICLFLFGYNNLMDGKKVEYAHQFAKLWQTLHNNFRLPYTEMITRYAARMLSVFFVFNGGRCGDNLQYKLGPAVTNLKHSQKPIKPHPIIAKLFIDRPPPTSPKIEIKQLYPTKKFKQNYVLNLFYDE